MASNRWGVGKAGREEEWTAREEKGEKARAGESRPQSKILLA